MEGSDPVHITDIDAEVTDEEGDPIQWLTATVTSGFKSGDILSADTTGTNITVTFDADAGVLKFSGQDSLANYTKVLRTVTYTCGKDNQNPIDTPQRVVEFVANDGNNDSNKVISTITVVAVNDAPVNSVPGSQSADVNEILTFSQANGNKISVTDIDITWNDKSGCRGYTGNTFC